MTARTVGQVLADRVRRYREAAGMRQEDLADAVAKLGYPLNRVTIAKIEKGGTRADNASLTDVLVLAAALDCPPLLLVLPLGEDEEMEIIPGGVVHPHVAYDWIVGDDDLRGAVPTDFERWQRNHLPIWAFRKLRDLQDVASRTEATDEDRRRLADHLEYMEQLRLVIPGGVAELAELKGDD